MTKAKTLPLCPAPGAVFVDGPSMDMTLSDILGRKPNSTDRPRWEVALAYCKSHLGCRRAEFVFNGRHFDSSNVFSLYRALRFMGWEPKAPKDNSDDPVDTYIRSELIQIARSRSSANVVLLSHDHGYAPYLASVLRSGASVSMIGFREELAPDLLALEGLGAIYYDLEYDVGAFRHPLNRPYRPAWL